MASSSNSDLPKRGRNQLSQVTFTEIPERYLPNEDVKVTYTLNGTWKPSTSDWIGLFREEVGDSSNYITYVYSRTSLCNLENESVALSVTFRASYLPKGGTGSYRFCYVTRQGNIRGKSSCFIFANPEDGSSTDSDASSDIVIVEKGFGDFEKMQTELDDVKRQNFSLRKSLEEKENEAKTMSDLLKSAETQIELLCTAIRKQEEEQQNSNREITIKLQEEANFTNQKLLESEANRNCLAHQVKALQENSAAMEEEMSRQIHKAETERDCLQAELNHLQEATATSRFRETELRKALEAAHDTTQALIHENHEMHEREQRLLLAEKQIQALTKDLNLSEQIRQELLAKNMQFESEIRSRSSSKADHSDQQMDSSVDERTGNYRRFSVEQSQEMEHDTSDTDASSSSINTKPSSGISAKEQKRFLPNPIDRILKAMMK